MDFFNLPPQGTLQLLLITVILTAMIGAMVKSVGEFLLRAILAPFKPMLRLLYLWIAPQNIFSIPLRVYRRSLSRSNLSRIENPVGPAIQIPLEQAFAPLKLVSKSQPEGIELFSTAASGSRLMILGGPGSGKTTLMKSLLSAIIHKRCNQELNDLVPVFVVLRKLASKNHSVEQAIVAALAENRYPKAERFVEAALRQGRMLIILDGLDEVGASRQFVTEQIIEFCEADSLRTNKNRVIVTCREASYRSEDLRSVIPDVVRVEPFANHHIRVFLQGWPSYKGRIALKLYGMIQADSQIRDICRNPLLLTILTGLYLDSEHFELPSSRELFYKSAIDELMIKRPARRGITQKISDTDKKRILERTSLHKLQTIQPSEDPEVFSRDSLLKIAKEVVGQTLDPETLVNELTNINGIIRIVGDDIFTFAHRTIQEYFAAREATRMLRTEEILEQFWSHRDLSEVLYFSCGLIHNVPQLQTIVHWCMSNNDWNGATKCLLNMTESPGKRAVLSVTEALYQHIEGGDTQIALELLSSLGQRSDHDYDNARERFFQAVDLLTTKGGDAGLAALGSALSTRPETAMRIIPVLIEHPSANWRQTAVRLLRDIGTDEALDRLVQLLSGKPSPEREEAGHVLADILKTRHSDLLRRIDLFPEMPVDKVTWPLNKYLPSRIALAIASAIIDADSPTNNPAINCAVAALRRRKGLSDKTDWNERDWRLLSRHLTFNLFRYRIGLGLTWIGYAVVLLSLLAFLVLDVSARLQGKIIFLDRHFKMTSLQADMVEKLGEHAITLRDSIKRRFQPKARGIVRVLPWNWKTELILPEGSISTYKTLEHLIFNLDRGDLFTDWKYPEAKDLRVLLQNSEGEIISFSQLAQKVTASLPTVSPPFSLFGANFVVTIFIIFITLITSFLAVMTHSTIYILERTFDLDDQKGLPHTYSSMLKFMSGSVNYTLISLLLAIMISALVFKGEPIYHSLVALLLFVIMGTGYIIQRLYWPRNEYLGLIAEVTGQQVDMGTLINKDS